MAQHEHYYPTVLPLPKKAHTIGGSIHLRPDLAHTYALSASIAPDTLKLTHSPGKQGNTHVTNRQSPMKTDWRGPPLTLRDKAETIHKEV